MDCNSEDCEESCELKQDRVHQDTSCLIVENSNYSLKYFVLKLVHSATTGAAGAGLESGWLAADGN